MQRNDLKLREEQALRETLWHISPHPRHKVSLELFDSYGTLRITKETINFQASPSPDQIKSNTHSKALIEREVYPFLEIKTM